MTIISEFQTTDENDFEVLTDVVDARLSIICHKPTGYFNVTKIANLVHELKVQDANGKHVAEKPTRIWFQNNDINELMEDCCKLENVDKVRYNLDAGTPKKYAGTYINELLYHQFMQWLDKRYALKVSYLLKQFRIDITERIVAEKNAEILNMSDVIIEQQDLLDAIDEVFDANEPMIDEDSDDDYMSDDEE